MPKIVDHEQYRKELLHKCFDLFAQKGYASITTRQVAKELGVSTGTLYYYFPRKEDMFEQLVEEMSQEYLQIFASELKDGQTRSERFEALANFAVKYEDRLIKEICMMVDFCQQQGIEAVRNNAVLARIRHRNKQAFADLFRIPDPALADFVMIQLMGLMLARMEDNHIPIFEQVTLLGKILTTYLGR
ncbi:TetR/AcrR family transcriptional regulator [Microcoleus sp. FACHB-672]|uniref:TetR/AcrR family transcriptional regulator n=1 Tax=Microcoleus sp. FACHB-672 TaxID=2692825 RepID=UPI0016872F1A|nr:TetR/AcrR family transcriptional regulator [Microcoleus sp. FACHB-672]MBD2040137.1 TetR/AcrR family transcriptional regulator [Microcoleus sp. FACHB-672]